MHNQYWLNQGNGKFIDQALLTGCAVDKNGKAKAGMGTCAADIDHDDDLDLLVVNLQAQSDSFFRNEGQYFADDTPAIGLGTSTRPFTRFGVGWVDFNNDGNFDLFQANGRVTLPDLSGSSASDPFAEPNILLVGNGTQFSRVDSSLYPQTSRTSRAAAFGDLDNDGAVDVVVINRDNLAEVLMNGHKPRGNWLLIRAVNRLGRDDIGAIVRLAVAGRSLRRDLNPHYSYLASNDPRIHIGLGSAAQVDGITIEWIDGTSETFGPLAANQIIILRQGEGLTP
jgi:hypothetical protein